MNYPLLIPAEAISGTWQLLVCVATLATAIFITALTPR